MGEGTFKSGRTLVMDLNPETGPGVSLQKAIESNSHLEVFFCKESIGTDKTLSNDTICELISKITPGIIFLILPSGSLKFFADLVNSIRKLEIQSRFVVVTESVRPDEIIEFLRSGAADFITPPFNPADIIPRIWRLTDRKTENDELICNLKEKLGLRQIIGSNPDFLKELDKISFVSKCNSSVLISGETGTGKELFARAIHYLSLRSDKPFIALNCGAVPLELVENELFGHARGAFTGAHNSANGLIHESEGGTLFLDEIDCLPLPAQVKLLRFLQEKEYRQLGSGKLIRTDVRILAGSNTDLEAAVREGIFRKDLFYRLNIIPISLPPLRNRRDDIPLLSRHFLTIFALELEKPVVDFTSEAVQKLIMYDWPGNIRELENIIERAVVLAKGDFIGSGDISLPDQGRNLQESFQIAKAKVIEQFERDYIHSLLLANQGNITKAAKAAEKNRRAFWELIRKHKINVRNYSSGLLNQDNSATQ